MTKDQDCILHFLLVDKGEAKPNNILDLFRQSLPRKRKKKRKRLDTELLLLSKTQTARWQKTENLLDLEFNCFLEMQEIAGKNLTATEFLSGNENYNFFLYYFSLFIFIFYRLSSSFHILKIERSMSTPEKTSSS